VSLQSVIFDHFVIERIHRLSLSQGLL